MNQNHTHFLLVDNSSSIACGNEIKFRVNLENELTKGKSLKDYLPESSFKSIRTRQKCPLVLIVIKGGFHTLELIHYYQKTPILILVGTQGCADLIHQILQLSDEK